MPTRSHPRRPQCKQMRDDDRNTLYVDFHHLEQHDILLADAIAGDYFYLEDTMRAALRLLMQRHHPEHVSDDKEFYVSFYNMSSLYRVRDMKCDCVGRLIRCSTPAILAPGQRPSAYSPPPLSRHRAASRAP